MRFIVFLSDLCMVVVPQVSLRPGVTAKSVEAQQDAAGDTRSKPPKLMLEQAIADLDRRIAALDEAAGPLRGTRPT
jgi:hypothetical protein